jgi:hypothetical protein
MNLCHRLGSGDLTPTIAGMGARIKSYKKRIKAAKKSKEKNTQDTPDLIGSFGDSSRGRIE